ncbi:hypothetical protein [Brevundimonas faecalis]|uniref:Uncharacterized protein n=1 Tax=Brevundimonas faecalis TaxID=947378 RepID=A0ABV2R754_9CAUL
MTDRQDDSPASPPRGADILPFRRPARPPLSGPASGPDPAAVSEDDGDDDGPSAA